LVENSAKLPIPSQKTDKQDPFADYQINDKSLHSDFINSLKSTCPSCKLPKTLYCPNCYQIISCPQFVPHVELPILLDVVFHPNVSTKNSTSVHAKLLCSEKVAMHKDMQIPDYDTDSTYILFPSDKSVTFSDLSIDELHRIKR
jgi:hypothetical protein